MSFCGKCGNALEDGQEFCPKCGNATKKATSQGSANAQANAQAGQTAAQQPVNFAPPTDPTTSNVYTVGVDMGSDYTHTFNQEDISKNKVFALGVYLMGILGIIIAMLAAQKSPFAMFHAREAMKLQLTTLLFALITIVLAFTIVIPILYLVWMIIALVLTIICFVRAAKGQAKLVPIIGNMGMFK